MKKKSLIIGLAVLLTCLMAAGGTVAWLTAEDSATNTFTVGDLDISMAEDEWTDDSKIYPGAVIDKDPTVTVLANSEDCYVYIMVDNLLNGALANAVSLNIDTTNWIEVSTSGTKTLYRYKTVVSQSASDQTLPALFTTVTVSTTVVDETNIGSLDGETIVVKALAHQSNAITVANADTEAEGKLY